MRQKEKIHANCSHWLAQRHRKLGSEFVAAVRAYHRCSWSSRCVCFTSRHIYRQVCWRGPSSALWDWCGKQRQTGQWGIHPALVASVIPSEHNRRRSGRRRSSTKLNTCNPRCYYCVLDALCILKIQPGTFGNSEISTWSWNKGMQVWKKTSKPMLHHLSECQEKVFSLVFILVI